MGHGVPCAFADCLAFPLAHSRHDVLHQAAVAELGCCSALPVATTDTLNRRHPYLKLMMPGFVVGQYSAARKATNIYVRFEGAESVALVAWGHFEALADRRGLLVVGVAGLMGLDSARADGQQRYRVARYRTCRHGRGVEIHRQA